MCDKPKESLKCHVNFYSFQDRNGSIPTTGNLDRVHTHVPGIRVDNTANLGDDLPCSSSGKVVHKLSDGSISQKSCLSLFTKGQQVTRFQATILLPVRDLIAFQVGVVTSHYVQCEDPAMIVMIDPADSVGQTKPRHQCARERRYDAMKNDQFKTCAFKCLNYGVRELKLEVTVHVQVNKLPWVNKGYPKICEIEAYNFWKP